MGTNRKRLRISWREWQERCLFRSPLVAEACVYLASRCLSEGVSVVLDGCNLNPGEFSPFVRVAAKCGADVDFVSVKCSPEECVRRCMEKGGSQSDASYIRYLADKYKAVLEL